MPTKNEVIDALRNVAISEFPEAKEPEGDILVNPHGSFPYSQTIRVAWKTHDDSGRESKTINPIIIKILNTFVQDAVDNPSPDVLSIIGIQFAAFIRKKRRDFTPSAPDDPEKSPVPEYWEFPL